MTALELVGVVLLIVVAFALPAVGESVRRRADDSRDRDLDAEVLAKLDGDPTLVRDRGSHSQAENEAEYHKPER